MTTANLSHWQNIIKEKRKKTKFRDFVKEFGSWRPITFYKNNWIVSRYPQSNRIKRVVNYEVFEKNRDDLINKWITYDFKINFFSCFKNLFLSIDLESTAIFSWCENAKFADQVAWSKNIYLSFWVIKDCENILYNYTVKNNCRNILNSFIVLHWSENIFTSIWINNGFNIFYSRFINNSSNIWFSSNLTWCKECLFCNDLENKSYFIKNKQYTKEEYLTKKEEMMKYKNMFMSWYKSVDIEWKNYNSNNVQWIYLINSENIENGFYSSYILLWRNLVFCTWINWDENMYDVFWSTWDNKNFYWVTQSWISENVYCCYWIWYSSFIYYSYFLESCSFCLWCIWLKNKSYCILNKQYTKEEWYETVDKIFSQMNEQWILWNFFPWNLNPFYFNDTMASIIDPTFTKEEVTKEWYMWRDDKIKVDIPENAEIVDVKDITSLRGTNEVSDEAIQKMNKEDKLNNNKIKTLNDYQWFDSNWNWYINPDIMKKVIKDNNWNFYKIVPLEYDFLMKHWLPLPDIHWLDRIKMGFRF